MDRRPRRAERDRAVGQTPRLPAYMASINMTEVPLGVGSSETDLSYTFEAPVTVSSIMPLRGPAAGNTLLEVEGTGFGGTDASPVSG